MGIRGYRVNREGVLVPAACMALVMLLVLFLTFAACFACCLGQSETFCLISGVDVASRSSMLSACHMQFGASCNLPTMRE